MQDVVDWTDTDLTIILSGVMSASDYGACFSGWTASTIACFIRLFIALIAAVSIFADFLL